MPDAQGCAVHHCPAFHSPLTIIVRSTPTEDVPSGRVDVHGSGGAHARSDIFLPRVDPPGGNRLARRGRTTAPDGAGARGAWLGRRRRPGDNPGERPTGAPEFDARLPGYRDADLLRQVPPSLVHPDAAGSAWTGSCAR